MSLEIVELVLLFAVVVLLVIIAGYFHQMAKAYGWKDNHPDNHPNSNMEKNCSENLKECAKNIDDMKYKDDDMSFKEFKSTNAWSSANDDQKECISESADLGNNLATYEVMKCFKDPEYYEHR